MNRLARICNTITLGCIVLLHASANAPDSEKAVFVMIGLIACGASIMIDASELDGRR